MDYVQDIVNTKERKGTETAKLTEKRKRKKKSIAVQNITQFM
jgi:hypothetical protein